MTEPGQRPDSPENAEPPVWTEVDRARRRWILIVMWLFLGFNAAAVLYLLLD